MVTRMSQRNYVLVAEDDQDCAAVYADALEVVGFDAVITGTGQEALDTVELYAPCAVILDRGMRLADGSDLLEALLATGRIEVHRLLVITGGPIEGCRAKAIRKPATADDVWDHVRDCCAPKLDARDALA